MVYDMLHDIRNWPRSGQKKQIWPNCAEDFFECQLHAQIVSISIKFGMKNWLRKEETNQQKFTSESHKSTRYDHVKMTSTMRGFTKRYTLLSFVHLLQLNANSPDLLSRLPFHA